jgi:hypothetical protein
MRAKDFLIAAKNRETRRQKIDWLFLYFKERNIKKSYNTMIEWVGYTDEQIQSEIEEYLEREIVLEGGL